jgi:hypothetical protein
MFLSMFYLDKMSMVGFCSGVFFLYSDIYFQVGLLRSSRVVVVTGRGRCVQVTVSPTSHSPALLLLPSLPPLLDSKYQHRGCQINKHCRGV